MGCLSVCAQSRSARKTSASSCWIVVEGMVYDITEGRRQVATFPIYPDPTQKSTRILASYARLSKETFPDESRRYEMVVTSGGRVIARTKFTIRESAPARAERKAEERAIKKGSVVSF